MNPAPNQTNEPTSDREIRVERLLDAPHALVFEAFTKPEHVTRWWGPNGFSNTIERMEVREGGEWRYVMHGPDGVDYPNLIKYVEVVPPERLVYDQSGGVEEGKVAFRGRATFEDRGGKTLLTMCLEFPTREERDFVVENYGAIEGGLQTTARLAAYLATMEGSPAAESVPVFAIERVFDAPRELVYKAWTEPERLAKWWGPKGMDAKVETLDLRPGGEFRYGITMPDGATIHGKFVYWEISPPTRLLFLVSFCDASGTPVRHPMSATWPLEVLSLVTFEDLGGQTRLAMKGVPFNADDTDRSTFAAGRDGMKIGWGGTMDQLEAYLATGGAR